MSLIIATGSNIGNKEENLRNGKAALLKHFEIISESRIYKSQAVDYPIQPSFLNQVLEFKIPDLNADSIMEQLIKIEVELGRKKTIDKGPRVIDLDILFIGLKKLKTPTLTVPHPRLFERSFVLLPLREINFYTVLNKFFKFPDEIPPTATPYDLTQITSGIL